MKLLFLDAHIKTLMTDVQPNLDAETKREKCLNQNCLFALVATN